MVSCRRFRAWRILVVTASYVIRWSPSRLSIILMPEENAIMCSFFPTSFVSRPTHLTTLLGATMRGTSIFYSRSTSHLLSAEHVLLPFPITPDYQLLKSLRLHNLCEDIHPISNQQQAFLTRLSGVPPKVWEFWPHHAPASLHSCICFSLPTHTGFLRALPFQSCHSCDT